MSTVASSAVVRLSDQPAPATSLTDALARLDTLVSPLVGIVREVLCLLRDTDEVRRHMVAAKSTVSNEILGDSSLLDMHDYDSGEHFDPLVARAAALGEVAERYSARFAPPDRIAFGTAREVPVPTIEPEQFVLFHPHQFADSGFEFQPFTSDTPVRWIEGFSLDDGSPAWLPTQLVLLRSPEPDEVPIGYPTSNGLACGPTPEEAVLSALLELIERDAFMLAWHGRLSLPRIDLSSDTRLAELIHRSFRSAGLRHEVVDLSGFLEVPAALGVVLNDHSDVGALALGAAAAPDMATAITKALMEAYGTRLWVKWQQRERGSLPDEIDYAEHVLDLEDHAYVYGDHRRAALARFLVASPELRPVSDIPSLEGERPLEWIRSALRRLRAHGVSTYAVDVTSPDIREAGLFVMKVLSPDLQPLDSGFSTRQLGGGRSRRLYEAAWKLGLHDGPLEFGDLNPHPHPFP